MEHDIKKSPLLKQLLKLFMFLLIFDFINRIFIEPYVIKKTLPNKQDNNYYNNDNIDVINANNNVNNDIENRQNSKVLIKYCSSCGYKAQFDNVKLDIEASFPDITVEGSEFQQFGFKKLLSTLTTIIQFSIILLLSFGDKIFPYFNITPPELYYQIREKKLFVIIGVYFISSTIQSALMKTGAFEIYLNSELIFSKISSGYLPQTPAIIQLLNDKLII